MVTEKSTIKCEAIFNDEHTHRFSWKRVWGKAIVEKDVLGHPNMELALAIGVSAPTASLLQEVGLFTEVPLWGIIGESSTGKTTALRLMASVFGSPKEGTGLIKDFHATDTAIFAMLQDCGMIHLFDEATLRERDNFSSMLYSLSKGVDKLRCNSDGTLKERQSFSGSVVITGEQSLLEQSSVNLGLYARMVEVYFDHEGSDVLRASNTIPPSGPSTWGHSQSRRATRWRRSSFTTSASRWRTGPQAQRGPAEQPADRDRGTDTPP